MFESLFGGPSRGVQLTHKPLTEDGPSPGGKVVLFNPAHSFRRNAHGAVEGRRRYPPSQPGS